MEYKHFLTAIMGFGVVSVACLSQYGTNAPIVIFCQSWGLVCMSWFITTLPGMNDFMRSTAWVFFSLMVMVFGRQIPYMIDSPSVGPSFYPFMFVMIGFLAALITFAHLGDKK
tara:strand:- start:21950 stop:22288 length:339 start_codon:yes stop_codon:yes gene_type:complete